MYCSIADAYRTAGITSDEVSEADVTEFILDSESDADHETLTTYWSEVENGTASAVGASTVTVESGQNFIPNAYQGDVLWIYGGTGSGQVRKISSHTSTVFTVDRAWSPSLDTSSTYRIVHCGRDPYFSGSVNGNDQDSLSIDNYPLRVLESLDINGTTVTVANVVQFEKQGIIQLNSDAETGLFYGGKPQKVTLAYWWGVYPLPREVKRFTAVLAALKMLTAQMGGTFNSASSFSLPEGNVSVGQQYINIKGTWDSLRKEYDDLVERRLRRWPSFAS